MGNLFLVDFKKYFYDNQVFKSSWELAFYIWLKDHNIEFEFHPNKIEYKGDDGKTHFYYPNFIVGGQIVEIKGNHFFNEKGEPYDNYRKHFWWDKYNLIKEKGGIIIKLEEAKNYIRYVQDHYGKNFLKSCKFKQGSTTIPKGSRE